MMEQLLEKLDFEFNIKKGRLMNDNEEEMKTEARQLGIVKYEGQEGIKQVYLEVLEEAIKTGEDILAFERNEGFDVEEEFVEKYVGSRVQNKVSAQVICPATKEDEAYKKNHENKYTKIKLIKELDLDANINVVGDLVMTFSTNPEQGTLRRDRSEANTWKTLFRFLWDK